MKNNLLFANDGIVVRVLVDDAGEPYAVKRYQFDGSKKHIIKETTLFIRSGAVAVDEFTD